MTQPMIRNETEYREAVACLAEECTRLDVQRAALERMGLSPEEALLRLVP